MPDVKLSLDQKQQMQQRLTPQQIQTIKLLELPLLQLEQRIRRELEDNPMLEEAEMQDKEGDDDISVEDFTRREEYSIPYHSRTSDAGMTKNEIDRSAFIPSGGESLRDYLLEQLRFSDLTSEMEDITHYLIGNIDDDGYLRSNEQTLADDMTFVYGLEMTVPQIEAGIHIIQSLEPAGVGARDLKECLLLQFDRLPNMSEERILARRILSSYFDDFFNKRFDRLMSVLGISEEELRGAVEEIIHLSPKPGSVYEGGGDDTAPYIMPDFVVEHNNGEFIVRLNQRSMKELKISSNYEREVEKLSEQSAMHQKQLVEAQQFMRTKVRAAKWFINALQQRQHTLMMTMRAIVLYQREYFVDGDERTLRPMILRDISDLTGFDVSTISRVVNSKYVQTDFGIFLLRAIFSEGLLNVDGDEVSSLEVRKILRDSIDAEDKRAPLIDSELMEQLKEAGYDIARRTVTKYREAMGIPTAKMRREL